MLNDYSKFGHLSVECEDKTQKVGDVFNLVSSYYDLMNDLMSFGLHRLWKKYLIDFLNPEPGKHLLDVAGGSGDIAHEYLNFTKNFNPRSKVTILDINSSMLKHSYKRFFKGKCFSSLDRINGDAVFLPVTSKSIDYYTISFGLRNVTYIDRALKESYRVLKNKSKFICLEFSNPSFLFQKTYLFYLNKVLPYMGYLLAKDHNSYKYLADSITGFMSSDQLLGKMRSTGFSSCNCYTLNNGVVSLYLGFKL
jgi:demethylmenaquinone methyltransferase / 2-methoxy-6-polyprenyl-1,4-benzoquinol methylase